MSEHVVTSLVEAERIGVTARVFVATLLRKDAEVQRVFKLYQAHQPTSIPGLVVPTSIAEIHPSLLDLYEKDLRLLVPLVLTLGLQRFRWLPKALLIEFCRVEHEAQTGAPAPFEDFHVDDMPDAAAWPTKGRRRFGTIVRDVEWYYRNKIKRPPDKLYALGKEWAAQQKRDGITIQKLSQDSTVENAITRVSDHLDCIDIDSPIDLASLTKPPTPPT